MPRARCSRWRVAGEMPAELMVKVFEMSLKEEKKKLRKIMADAECFATLTNQNFFVRYEFFDQKVFHSSHPSPKRNSITSMKCNVEGSEECKTYVGSTICSAVERSKTPSNVELKMQSTHTYATAPHAVRTY